MASAPALLLAAALLAPPISPAARAAPSPLPDLIREAGDLTLDQAAARLRESLAGRPEAHTEHYVLGLALLQKLSELAPAPGPGIPPRPPPPRAAGLDAGPPRNDGRAPPGGPASPPAAAREVMLRPDHETAARLAPALAAEVAAACAALAASPDWRSRLVAADLLGWSGPAIQPPVPAGLARDACWPVRERAIRSLGRLPPDASLGILSGIAAQTGADSWRERVEAAKALGEAGAPERLLPLLNDPEDEVRLTAAYQFLRWQDPGPAAEKALRKAADLEKNARVRGELDRALSKHETASIPGPLPIPEDNKTP